MYTAVFYTQHSCCGRASTVLSGLLYSLHIVKDTSLNNCCINTEVVCIGNMPQEHENSLILTYMLPAAAEDMLLPNVHRNKLETDWRNNRIQYVCGNHSEWCNVVSLCVQVKSKHIVSPCGEPTVFFYSSGTMSKVFIQLLHIME